jgi:hypothetical protein
VPDSSFGCIISPGAATESEFGDTRSGRIVMAAGCAGSLGSLLALVPKSRTDLLAFGTDACDLPT